MSTGLPSYTEAAALVRSQAAEVLKRPHLVDSVAIAAAYGRVLALPIRADRNMPAFPRSTRDGFACRAAEASSHAPLSVAGSIRAGDPPAGPLFPGSAWEIMTGAAVPAGADAVAMLEHIELMEHLEHPEHVEPREGRICLALNRTLEPGENVVPEGAEARSGDEIVPIGTRLSPAHIAAAATCGYATLNVFVKPRVAILTTGDELVSVAENPAVGQIRNSNASMLAALVTAGGGDPWLLPTAKDDAGAIEAAISESLWASMVLISGGVSAGKFDLVEPALARLGARVHFTGVRIQPGKPLVYCEVPRRRGDGPRIGGSATAHVFGLPGNPISSAATFLLFAAQVLAALTGSAEVRPRFMLARLTREVKGKLGLTRFVPSACAFHPLCGGELEVAPVNWQGSGDLAAFARANCFLAVPEGESCLAAGNLVRILPF
jgi:molybdopterin molybdotransferase